MTVSETITFFIEKFILYYAICILSFYIILAGISVFVLRKYLRRRRFVDYNLILSSPFAPSISIIAPAYNESITIEENIRALLSLFYHNFEVIVVNDGSTDNSMEKLIKTYELIPVDFAVNYKIKTQEIKCIYKSQNKSFSNLIVVDKKNGGKADALNAGVNIAKNDYVVSVDADSILASDALLKLAKPILEEKKKKVIAAGGVVRIANSCQIEGGQILKVNVPRKLLPRFQVIEYTRSFLMGRMAWSQLNGLLIISGALGVFDKKILIKCGGYLITTVGEDMELVVRMRMYLVEQKQKYKVVYIPDPLCWTEVPANLVQLGRQRNRWIRGTIDTLKLHRKLFFNPRYGIMGMLSYPYWFFFEWLAPILEFFGILYFIIIALLGIPNWSFFFIMLGFVYFFAVSFSTYAILYEELTFHQYEKKSDLFKLFITAWIEPFIYHPLILCWSIKANFDYFILKKTGWGYLKKKGFVEDNKRKPR
jgi:cellulose synthase/poly-beta-1,6-N-acetylglucosamine synthase-like glycosyltransferase